MLFACVFQSCGAFACCRQLHLSIYYSGRAAVPMAAGGGDSHPLTCMCGSSSFLNEKIEKA